MIDKIVDRFRFEIRSKNPNIDPTNITTEILKEECFTALKHLIAERKQHQARKPRKHHVTNKHSPTPM